MTYNESAAGKVWRITFPTSTGAWQDVEDFITALVADKMLEAGVRAFSIELRELTRPSFLGELGGVSYLEVVYAEGIIEE